jgi:peptide/nickel transport system substrate-binding protein
MYKPCKSYYACGTPYSSDNTGIFTGKADPAKARKMLAEAGYKGEKVVLLRPTDLSFLTKVPMVVKQQWEAAGFKVDLQQSDWATVVARRARKDPIEKGGWSAYVSGWMGDDTRNPLTIAMMNASGDKGFFGWQDDKAMQDLMVDFSRAGTEAQRKSIAEKLQLRAFETASYVPLGQFNSPAAVRSNVSGIVPAGAQVYWNVKKD